MALSPHGSSNGPGTRSGTRTPHGGTHDDAEVSKPWYRKAGYGALVLALAGTVAAVVIVAGVDDTQPPSPGPGAGSATAPANTGAESSASARPYDEAYGTFEPITVSGSGRRTIALPPEAWDAGIVTATYAGSDPFDIVTRWRSTVVPWISMGLVHGPYSGTFTYGTDWRGSVKNLEVASGGWKDDGGPWEVTVAPVSSAETLPPVVSGTGDAVFLYSGAGADVVLQYQGFERFVALQAPLGQGYRVLVPGDVRGPGTRSAQLAPGPSIIEIRTDGSWKVTLEQ